MSIDVKRVLISDPVDEKCANLLISHGIEVTTKYKLSKEQLIEELKGHDGLIVRSETKVTADVIAAAESLKIIGRAGTGVDNIDVPAATRKGLLVLNTPGGNSISACELTCAMILALSRNIVQAGQSMREGRWDRKLYAGNELQDKCLGVLGFGRIGREVGIRMKAFGMRIVAFDPLLTDEQARELDVTKLSVEAVLEQADYITVHTPLIPQTRDLLNGSSMLRCKPGFRVVNVARGGIISEAGLLEMLESGHCAGAALDVFTEEPPKNSEVIRKLLQHPRLIATPHLGASTAEAQVRVAIEIAEQFLAASGRSTDYSLTGVVNAPALAAATNPANAPWIDLGRKLGIVAAKLVGPTGPVDCQLVVTPDKRFVSAALRLGLIANRVESQPNLISAANLADELGVRVTEIPATSGNDVVNVKIGSHEIKGTVVGNISLLLSIDNTQFEQGIRLGDNISLYATKVAADVTKIVSTHIAKSVSINSMSVGGNWVIVQTDKPASVVVDNVKSY